MPTQKSAGKWQLRTFATSCAKYYEGHSLVQTSFLNCPIAHLFLEQTQYVVDLKMDFHRIVFIIGYSYA